MSNKSISISNVYFTLWFITGITVCICTTQLAIDTLSPTAAIPVSILSIIILESIGYCVFFCQAIRMSTPVRIAITKCLAYITPAVFLSVGAALVVISANGLLVF